MKYNISIAVVMAMWMPLGVSARLQDTEKGEHQTRQLGSIPDLVEKNRKKKMGKLPAYQSGNFRRLCEAAWKGDAAASEKMCDQIFSHVNAVYSPLEKQGGLLFSCRQPEKGYNDPDNNYAVNLESYFEGTTDTVHIQKQQFVIYTEEGDECTIPLLQYDPVNAAVKVEDGDTACWLPLSKVDAIDRMFVENALMDDLFDSRSFRISVEDKRMKGAEMQEQGRDVRFSNGEVINTEDLARTEAKAISRSIVLENRGTFPLQNLIVEYQVFAEQTVMGLPDDFPEDYRCVGYHSVASLAPNEVKHLYLNLPSAVNKQLQDFTSGNTRYSRNYRPGFNDHSEGRINGIWVKVHRITPYGERLTVDYKSSGTPSAEWEAVVPVGAEIR